MKLPVYSFLAGVTILLLTSCGGNKGLADGATGDMETYESSDVNAMVQAKPEIMVLPSDGTLKRFGALRNTTDGINRDYQKYLLNDKDARTIFSAIQGEFQKQKFPLTDLEQTLKQLNSRDASDMADDIYLDAKTILLQTATPDIILELDYASAGGSDIMRHASKNSTEVAYTLNAIDAYTNKVIATITTDPVKGDTKGEAMRKQLGKQLPDLMDDIQTYFSDLLTRGREVTVRINVANGSNVSLSDTNAEGDTYSDYVMDYIKTHTVKGAYKLQANTDAELRFTNVRIKLLNDDGTQFGVYDWARDLAKSLRRDLGVKVKNRSQGLGEVVLTIEGI